MLISPLKFRLFFVQFQKISLWSTLLATLVGCRSPLIVVEAVSAPKISKTVYLTGKVVHLAPFLGNGAYQLQDGTGKIWVVTHQTLPQKNQQINLKGKIAYQSLPLAEQELGEFYLVELERPADLPQ
jgi:hypothetical protein